jgi:predicted Zn-dependent protease
MNPNEIAERALSAVGNQAQAEVVVSAGHAALTRFANSFIHQNVAEESVAIALRVEVDGRVSSSTATAASAESIERLVDATVESARLQPVDEEWPGLSQPAQAPPVDHFDEATASSSPDVRATMVRSFIGDGPAAAGYLDTVGEEVVYANSLGHSLQGRHSRATLDGIHQTPTSAGTGHSTSVRLSDIDAAATGAIAFDRAQRSADAHDIKPGDYEVVLSPECMATICMFLGLYGFNAKVHQEGQSCIRLGEAQFHSSVRLVDDATDERALGVGFDVDGTPKRRTVLVDDGTSASLAHSRRTAAKAGAESTGHALPMSTSWGPVPSNLFLAGGDQTVEDLIASVERGLYVAAFNYCRVLDPKSMAVTGLTRNGTFMIENGRITGAVTNLRFTQSFVQALTAVEGLGDDARFADSEFGPGLVHAPSARLASWNFTGGAGG